MNTTSPSLDNLDALQAIHLRPDRSEGKSQGPSKGQALEFIIAVPGRRYHEFADLLEPLQQQCAKASAETTGEVAWNGLRLVVAHDPTAALEQQLKRKATMAQLEAQANGWAGKPGEQDIGKKKKGPQALGQWRQGAFLPCRVRGASGKNHQGGHGR